MLSILFEKQNMTIHSRSVLKSSCHAARKILPCSRPSIIFGSVFLLWTMLQVEVEGLTGTTWYNGDDLNRCARITACRETINNWDFRDGWRNISECVRQDGIRAAIGLPELWEQETKPEAGRNKKEPTKEELAEFQRHKDDVQRFGKHPGSAGKHASNISVSRCCVHGDERAHGNHPGVHRVAGPGSGGREEGSAGPISPREAAHAALKESVRFFDTKEAMEENGGMWAYARKLNRSACGPPSVVIYGLSIPPGTTVSGAGVPPGTTVCEFLFTVMEGYRSFIDPKQRTQKRNSFETDARFVYNTFSERSSDSVSACASLLPPLERIIQKLKEDREALVKTHLTPQLEARRIQGQRCLEYKKLEPLRDALAALLKAEGRVVIGNATSKQGAGESWTGPSGENSSTASACPSKSPSSRREESECSSSWDPVSWARDAWSACWKRKNNYAAGTQDDTQLEEKQRLQQQRKAKQLQDQQLLRQELKLRKQREDEALKERLELLERAGKLAADGRTGEARAKLSEGNEENLREGRNLRGKPPPTSTANSGPSVSFGDIILAPAVGFLNYVVTIGNS